MPEATLTQRQRDRLVDVAAVVVVLWFTLAQYGSQGFGEYRDVATEPDGLGFGIILAGSLPLLVRRRFPWPVLLIAIAASIALVALGYAVHAPAAVAVALYTFAARPDRGDIWPPIALTAAGYAAMVVVETATLDLSLEEYVIPVVLLVGAWLVGDRRRTTRQRAAEARERQEREQRLTVAEERARIARELHDSAGHAINTILVQAGAARVLRERDPERSRAAIETIEEVARETVEDIDRIVGFLRDDESPELAPLPGLDGIPALVERQRAAGLEIELRAEEHGNRAPPPAVGRAAYRIAQEALTNAARHGAGSAQLAIDRREDAIELTVANPVGEQPGTRPGGGRGIAGMRERATLVGGSLEAGRDGEGFRVRAVLPYDRRGE
ncbi:MAG TPA: histidine kinase [Solirubrobacterales bacterium]|jgi:signal transduction histidine kinase|nr:histidine kinase [Solirubrobacterales bacterium]